MNSTTHMIVGGLTGGLVLAHCISNRVFSVTFSGYEIYPVIVTAAGIVGGMAPDVDMPRSKAGRFLRNALRTTLLFSALFLAVMFLVPKTGIGVLDRAVELSSGINRNIPLILAALCIIIMVVIEKSSHRGFTHTPVALLVIASPLLYMLHTKKMFTGADVVVSAQIGFILGWFSHMVADTFNYPGTPWLWPFVRNHFNIMRVDSGTKQERVFRNVSIAVFCVCYVAILLKMSLSFGVLL